MTARHPHRLAATLVAIVTTLVTVLPTQVAFACSCAFMDPGQALASGPAAAFVGTLRDVQPGGGETVMGPAMRWTFEVEAVLAGELAPTVEVLAAQDSGANCGLNVAPGERVGLLLYPETDGWGSSSCSTYDADALLAAGEPVPPDPALAEPTAEPAATSSGVGWLGLAATVVAAVAVLGAAAVLVRRRSAS